MINTGPELLKYINELLIPHGFVKNKSSWYHETNECVCFIAFEKSRYSFFYGSTVGVFIKEINPLMEKFPKYYKSNLRYGLEDLCGKENVKKVFDIENTEYNDNEREILISQIFNNHVIPFTLGLGSKEGIVKSFEKYDKLIYYADLSLRKALNITS